MSTSKQVTYVDFEGRKWLVLIPEDAPDSDAVYGVIVGPQSLDELELPLDVEVRLHNELYVRGLFTYNDVRKRRTDVAASLQYTFRADVDRIIEVYFNGSK